ncbi:MAG TPA: ABC transporter permease [Phycisphaerae bacterium]|nr:ABC transporter permease [Phycisphaerae bacterium]HRW55208.1 ABC transporter permease [Phycisphaerae bacterium]
MTWRTLHRQLVRTALSALGVAIGVIAIVALGAVSKGLRASVQGGITSGGSDMMIWEAGVAADIFSSLDEADTRAKLAEFPEITEVAAGLSHLIRTPGMRSVAALQIVIGVYPDEFGQQAQEPSEGRRFRTRDEAVVGYRFAEKLNKKVGDTLEVGDRTYTIVGTFRSGVVFFDGAIVLHIDEVRRLNGRAGRVTSFNVRLKPGTDAQALAGRIEEKYPELAVITDESEYHKVDQGLDASDDMVAAVSFIALIVGSLVIANTMWMSVAQRTREIGVLRAIGWPRRRIVGMVLMEAFGIGVIGCGLGMVLGVLLAELTRSLPFSWQFMSPIYPPVIFLRAMAIALVLSVVGALIPALRAARVTPVEALRYE